MLEYMGFEAWRSSIHEEGSVSFPAAAFAGAVILAASAALIFPAETEHFLVPFGHFGDGVTGECGGYYPAVDNEQYGNDTDHDLYQQFDGIFHRQSPFTCIHIKLYKKWIFRLLYNINKKIVNRNHKKFTISTRSFKI